MRSLAAVCSVLSIPVIIDAANLSRHDSTTRTEGARLLAHARIFPYHTSTISTIFEMESTLLHKPRAAAKSLQSFRNVTAAYFDDDDERFTDFIIKCAGTEHKFHRIIISASSRYFPRCCGGAFLEAGTQNIELRGDEPAAVERMIQFFYTHDYDDVATEGLNSIELNAQVYATAEKYEVPQ